MIRRSLSFAGSETGSRRTGSRLQKLWRQLSLKDVREGSKWSIISQIPVSVAEVVDDGHPLGLGNPKILRSILTYLDTKDLVNIRLVNLRWNHVSCELLRRRLGPCRIKPSKMKYFLRLMKRCFSNPFGFYALRIETLRDPNVRSFFRRFSQEVIGLRVKIDSNEIPDFFNGVLQQLTNLEELHIIRIPECPLYLRTDYIPPTSWLHGAYHFPKLKCLILENDEPLVSFQRNYDAILSEVVNSAPNLVKLIFVGWDSHFSRVITRCGVTNPKSFDGWAIARSNPQLKEDLIELFYERKFNFKALKFCVDKSTSITFELLIDFVLQTADSIYHLAIKNDDNEEMFQSSLQLRRLLTLNLQGWLGPVDFRHMQSQLPILKCLKLHPDNFKGILERFNDDNWKEFRMSSVEVLTVMPFDELEDNPVDKELIQSLTMVFPNVREFYAQITGNNTLHTIYEHWSNLRVLWIDIRGHGCSDEALTGLPDEEVEITGTWDCGCARYTILNGSRRQASIEKLQGLQSLIIRAGCLTDNSIYEGISGLKCIRTLWFLPEFHVNLSDDDQENNNQICFKPTKPWCLKLIADCFKHLRHLVTPVDDVYSKEELNYLKAALPDLIHEFKS